MRDVENIIEQIHEQINAPIADDAGADTQTVRDDRYLTTVEASRHMRRSVSWLLRQKDIPYFRGKPNLYLKADLDFWFEANRRYVPLSIRGQS